MYSDLLQDPRWQKRRLEVFERDGWRCLCCGEKDKTLHVHHLKYSENPWDAKDEDLETLCWVCHGFRTDFDKFFKRSTVPTQFCSFAYDIIYYGILDDADFIKSNYLEIYADIFPALRKRYLEKRHKIKEPVV